MLQSEVYFCVPNIVLFVPGMKLCMFQQYTLPLLQFLPCIITTKRKWPLVFVLLKSVLNCFVIKVNIIWIWIIFYSLTKIGFIIWGACQVKLSVCWFWQWRVAHTQCSAFFEQQFWSWHQNGSNCVCCAAEAQCCLGGLSISFWEGSFPYQSQILECLQNTGLYCRMWWSACFPYHNLKYEGNWYSRDLLLWGRYLKRKLASVSDFFFLV